MRAPTAEGLRELIHELLDLEAQGKIGVEKAKDLTSTIEVATHFKTALEALEALLGTRLNPPEAPAGGWGPALDGAGIEEVLRDPDRASRVRGLLDDLLRDLRTEFSRLAFDRGVLNRKDDAASLEGAVETFRGYVGEKGREITGLDAVLSAYHLVLSARLARLAAALEGGL